MPRLGLLILLAALAAAGCGSDQAGGGSGSKPAELSRSDTRSSDAVKLVVTWQGRARQLGRSVEWYQPRSGYYHVTHTTSQGELETVFGAPGITARTREGLYTATGSRESFAQGRAAPDIFVTPGVALVHLYLNPRLRQPGVHFVSHDGGHSFSVVWRYEGDTSVVDLHGTITVAERVGAGDAARLRLFEPLDGGRPLGGAAQRDPGSHPEHATGYWFGDRLGDATAATELESWGTDPLTGRDPEREVRTIYRMPVSELPGEVPPMNTSNYPGQGGQATTDIWVECMPRPAGYLPGQLASTPPQTVTIAHGARATLYLSSYTQADATGTDATFITDDGTACMVRGLITPDQLRASLKQFTRL